jgi:hypothetical protein
MALLDGIEVDGLSILARAVQEFAACVKDRHSLASTPHVNKSCYKGDAISIPESWEICVFMNLSWLIINSTASGATGHFLQGDRG